MTHEGRARLIKWIFLLLLAVGIVIGVLLYAPKKKVEPLKPVEIPENGLNIVLYETAGQPESAALGETIERIGTKYDNVVDRESAEEILKGRADQAAAQAAEAQAAADAAKAQQAAQKEADRQRREEERAERERRRNPSFQDQIVTQLGRTVQRQVMNRVAGSIVRGTPATRLATSEASQQRPDA